MELLQTPHSHAKIGMKASSVRTGVPARMQEERSDAELVAALGGDQVEALGPLFRRHGAASLRLLGRLGIDRADADDLLQAVFLALPRAAKSYDSSYSVRSWILGVTAMWVRRHRRSLATWAAKLGRLSQSEPTILPSGPDELAERQQAAQRLAQAMERLAHKKREAFVLVTLEGLSGEQVAQLLQVPVNTVWTRLHHARAELRAAVGEVL